jgi:hypothetical protein
MLLLSTFAMEQNPISPATALAQELRRPGKLSFNEFPLHFLLSLPHSIVVGSMALLV